MAALVILVEPGSSVRKTSWYCFSSWVILRFALNCCHAVVHFFNNSNVGLGLICKVSSMSDSSESPILLGEVGCFEVSLKNE